MHIPLRVQLTHCSVSESPTEGAPSPFCVSSSPPSSLVSSFTDAYQTAAFVFPIIIMSPFLLFSNEILRKNVIWILTASSQLGYFNLYKWPDLNLSACRSMCLCFLGEGLWVLCCSLSPKGTVLILLTADIFNTVCVCTDGDKGDNLNTFGVYK